MHAGRRFPSSAYFSVIQRRFDRATDLTFLPFMTRLRFLEIYLDLGSGTWHDFNVLSLLMGSLSVSLTSPEHLEFNIRFYGCSPFNCNTFYENLPIAWSHLDTIATHPTSSQLRRVDINISCIIYEGQNDGVKPDKNKISKAVLDGLPLLCTKGILFVKTSGLENRALDPDSWEWSAVDQW